MAAEWALDDAGRQFKKIDQCRRGKDAIAGLPAEFLDACGSIYRIAEKDDFLLDGAHFARDHRSAVQSSSAMYLCTEVAQIGGAERCQSVQSIKTGAHAVRVSDTVCQFPGRDQLIADISVDFAIGRHDRFSDIDDKAVDQAVKGEFAEPLSKGGRALYIDEEEYALFQSWLVVVAGNEIEEHVLSQQ